MHELLLHPVQPITKRFHHHSLIDSHLRLQQSHQLSLLNNQLQLFPPSNTSYQQTTTTHLSHVITKKKISTAIQAQIPKTQQISERTERKPTDRRSVGEHARRIWVKAHKKNEKNYIYGNYDENLLKKLAKKKEKEKPRKNKTSQIY